MKILADYKTAYCNVIFECVNMNCGCIFEAGYQDYHEAKSKEGTIYVCECPKCHKKTWRKAHS